MTTTVTPSLIEQQAAAVAEADRLGQEIARLEAARQEAADAARAAAVHAANPRVLDDEIEQAERSLEGLAVAETLDYSALFAAYVRVRDLVTERHYRHRAINGELHRVDGPALTPVGAEIDRFAIADTWAETPWTVLVDRVIERRLLRIGAQAMADQQAVFNDAADQAARAVTD